MSYVNTAISFGRRLGADAALQWKVLAALQASLSIWLVQESQQNPSLTLLAVVVWGGAVICVEDQLDGFEVRPSRMSALAGITLLAYATWRSTTVLGQEAVVFVLPPIQALGLALLARPARRSLSFGHSLFILALFPVQFLLARVLPEYWLSVVTGRVSQVFLLLFGINASLAGRELNLAQGSVRIAGACNGVDLIVQVTVIAIVFVLAFPIRGLAVKSLYLASAPLIAFLVNSSRISLLAVINSSALPHKKAVFDFMHEEWGGLVFAGVATVLIGQIYMAMIDRHLALQAAGETHAGGGSHG